MNRGVSCWAGAQFPKAVISLREMKYRAFTLIEAVMSMMIASIVFAAIGSAIAIASKAVPGQSTNNEKVIDATSVLQTMVEELENAIHFTKRGIWTVSFTVADRTADGTPESIAYRWTGSPGDPLTRTYNSRASVTVLPDVQMFALAYSVRPRDRKPHVLLVVHDLPNLTAQDAQKKNLIESWGYPVQLIQSTEPQANFDQALTNVDEVYISEDVESNNLNTKLYAAAIGVVNEEPYLMDEFRLSSNNPSSVYKDDAIVILDNTHPVTSVFPAGMLTICSSKQWLGGLSSSLAPGVVVLAKRKFGTNPALLVVEAGIELKDGRTAMGRRVQLPWGGNSFDITDLNHNGVLLMQRAVDWAAGSYILTGAHITLQSSLDASGHLETEAQILNEPGVAGP